MLIFDRFSLAVVVSRQIFLTLSYYCCVGVVMCAQVLGRVAS